MQALTTWSRNDRDVTSNRYIYLTAKYKLPILSLQSLDLD